MVLASRRTPHEIRILEEVDSGTMSCRLERDSGMGGVLVSDEQKTKQGMMA